MKLLEGKVAIITGASKGMCAVYARLFVQEGAKVILTARSEDKGLALAEELGDNAIFVKHDVGLETDWRNVMQVAQSTFGHVNILVNNAGMIIRKPLTELSLEEYISVLYTNQVSVFLGMRHVVPLMEKAGGGSIINVSSLSDLVAGTFGYTDTKFAVRGMTKTAAVELAKKGIRVNSIHPGVVPTPMVVQPETEHLVEAYAKAVPLKRVAELEEISKMVLFLASDNSSYSTGSEFVVDGGMSAQ